MKLCDACAKELDAFLLGEPKNEREKFWVLQRLMQQRSAPAAPAPEAKPKPSKKASDAEATPS